MPGKHMITATFVLACAMCAFSGEHPNMFINQAEITAIKAKADAGNQPWKSAYDRLVSKANSALTIGMKSITDNGGVPTKHEWSTCNDERHDYSAAMHMCHAARDLGIAYAFTNDSRYAEKTIQIINHWCVNAETRMTPDSRNRSCGNTSLGSYMGDIEIFITIPGMIYGGDCIAQYSGWNASDKSAFQQWVSDIGYSTRSRHCGENNFLNWKLALVAAAGAFLDDTTLLEYAFTTWKETIAWQAAENGELPLELVRTNAHHYSRFSIKAMTTTAEIARRRGFDAYSHVAGGRSLELILDHHQKYAMDPAQWTADGYKQPSTEPMNAYHFWPYEAAYSRFRKQSYLDVVNKWGRPAECRRVTGPVTLSAGNGFDICPATGRPPAVSITAPQNGAQYTSPASITVTADASDPDGSVSIVEFFSNGKKIGQAESAPYQCTWNNTYGNGTLSLTARARDNIGNVTTSAAVNISQTMNGDWFTALPDKFHTSSATRWYKQAIGTQTGKFTLVFDAIPANSYLDGTMGISTTDSLVDWRAMGSLACVVRFNTNGYIDALNGNAFTAVNQLRYSSGVPYRVRMEVDVSSRTCNVAVTPYGAPEVVIAQNYAFRTGQSGATLTTWTIYTERGPMQANFAGVTPGITGTIGKPPTAGYAGFFSLEHAFLATNSVRRGSPVMIRNLPSHTSICVYRLNGTASIPNRKTAHTGVVLDAAETRFLSSGIYMIHLNDTHGRIMRTLPVMIE